MARSKFEHLLAQDGSVKLGQKEYTLPVLKNRELFKLMDDLGEEVTSLFETETEDMEENLIKYIVNIIQEKPVEVINKLVKEDFTKEDWLEANPTQVYNLAMEFKETNFFFLNKMVLMPKIIATLNRLATVGQSKLQGK